MSKICVTGCAGFVGSRICDRILNSGNEVIGIDNLSSKINYTPSNVRFHFIDLNDNIKEIIKDVDTVVHAAAHAELRHNWESIEQRKKLFLNNEMATLNLLEQMPNVPIIFLSSASVYGSLSQKISRPLIETDFVSESIESPYAASKIACESYVAAWSFKRKTPWYVLRLVNQVGKNYHRGVITDFYKQIVKNNHIHALDNGEQTKSWVSVEDTASAVNHLINFSNIPSGVYNVTSLERWSWRDIVNVMKEECKTEATFSLTYAKKLASAIGDPINLHISGKKLDQYFMCRRPVKNSVVSALKTIGWLK